MNEPESDPIRSRPSIHLPARPAIDRSLTEDPVDLDAARMRNLLAGTVFGACVGLLIGPVVGEACRWLLGFDDSPWFGAAVGLVLGPSGGAVLGFLERKLRGNLCRPDIATFIGGLYAIPLSALAFCASVRTLPSGLSIALVFCGSPFTGLLIGAMLDRSYETISRRSWISACGYGLAGVACCIGLLLLMARLDSYPDAKEVAREARAGLVQAWRDDPSLNQAKIRKVTLTHQGARIYTGVVEAVIADRPTRFFLNVVVEEQMLRLKWELMED